MDDPKMVQVGDVVKFVDAVGVSRPALVTEVWGDRDAEGRRIVPSSSAPSINIVAVSMLESETDSYGRQIERETSIVHRSNQAAHGMFWE